MFCIVCIVCIVLYCMFGICLQMFCISPADGHGQHFSTIHLCQSKKKCSVLEEDASKLMFEIAIGSKIFECLCRSHE